MAEVAASPVPVAEKHNTGKACGIILGHPSRYLPPEPRPPVGPTGLASTNPPPTVQAPSAQAPVVSGQLPPRPPLNRVDSRSSFPPQVRPAVPPPQPIIQQRPQFLPGAPVNNPPQFAARPGTPTPRPQTINGAQIPQQVTIPRVQGPPVRLLGQPPFASQQGFRPPQLIGANPGPRAPPGNLQFGPRQPPQFPGSTTPDSSKPLFAQTFNGVQKNSPVPPGASIPPILRQPSQNSFPADISNQQLNRPANMEINKSSVDNPNANKVETFDVTGAPKSRSYSIAAPHGSPSPLKLDDDRRKSISVVGGRPDEMSRSPGLTLIQESKSDSHDNIRESKESVQSEITVDRYSNDRPESRISSKMTESFIGSLPETIQKKRLDDDDVIVSHKPDPPSNQNQSKPSLPEYSSPAPRKDEFSSEGKPKLSQNMINNQPEKNAVTESSHFKTSNIQSKTDNKSNDSQLPQTNVPARIATEVKTTPKKPTELNTTAIIAERPTPRKAASAPRHRTKDGDNDSGVDESTQGHDLNGSPGSPNKKANSKIPTKEKSNGNLKISLSRSSSKSAAGAKSPENPPSAEKKKVPMNKIQVGNAPSPNIKSVKSKIGSLGNATYKPGGGQVKIENRKLDFQNVTPRIAAKNDKYTPSGGTKKITTTKLEWNAKSKIGSLDNTTYKPGGGDKKIETVKLDFKDKAKPKVASTVNITHKPGGGDIKIENKKLDIKAESKVGSLGNLKHKPKGGDVKIFDDKEYLKQMTGQSPAPLSQSHSRQEDYMSIQEWSDDLERPLTRAATARTPRTPRTLSPRRADQQRVERNNERNNERNIERNYERNRRPVSARSAPARPRSAASRRVPLSERPAFTVY